MSFGHDMNANPLAKYFRVPGIHIRLPTNGAFMPPGSVEFTAKGDLPVYPMRAADELLLKSPDALMSGYAIEKLIESCIPAIKYPRLISSPDLDVILLAIRAATYGETITLSPACPSCGAQNETHRSLAYLINNMTMIEPENVVRLTDDVLVYLKPYSMVSATTLGVASFEETRQVQAVENASSEKRTAQVNKSMQRLSELATAVLADYCHFSSMSRMELSLIGSCFWNFSEHISKGWNDKIQSKLEEINKKGIDKSYDITCAACSHEWKTQIEFNPSTFFASGSSQ